MWIRPRTNFKVRRGDINILDVNIPGGISTGIKQSFSYLEWEAATHAKLDLDKWERGIYSKKFKAKVIAFYKISRAVESYTNYVINKANKRKK